MRRARSRTPRSSSSTPLATRSRARSPTRTGWRSFDLPGGAYYVEVEAVKGLMGAAEAQAFAFLGGDQVDLLFGYDTGIR